MGLQVSKCRKERHRDQEVSGIIFGEKTMINDMKIEKFVKKEIKKEMMMTTIKLKIRIPIKRRNQVEDQLWQPGQREHRPQQRQELPDDYLKMFDIQFELDNDGYYEGDHDDSDEINIRANIKEFKPLHFKFFYLYACCYPPFDDYFDYHVYYIIDR